MQRLRRERDGRAEKERGQGKPRLRLLEGKGPKEELGARSDEVPDAPSSKYNALELMDYLYNTLCFCEVIHKGQRDLLLFIRFESDCTGYAFQDLCRLMSEEERSRNFYVLLYQYESASLIVIVPINFLRRDLFQCLTL